MNYTVNISLPKQLANLAKTQVKEGHYSSLSEVVRAALRHYLGVGAPVYKMSLKAERKAKLALKEHRDGKTLKLNSVDDFDKL